MKDCKQNHSVLSQGWYNRHRTSWILREKTQE